MCAHCGCGHSVSHCGGALQCFARRLPPQCFTVWWRFHSALHGGHQMKLLWVHAYRVFTVGEVPQFATVAAVPLCPTVAASSQRVDRGCGSQCFTVVAVAQGPLCGLAQCLSLWLPSHSGYTVSAVALRPHCGCMEHCGCMVGCRHWRCASHSHVAVAQFCPLWLRQCGARWMQ